MSFHEAALRLDLAFFDADLSSFFSSSHPLVFNNLTPLQLKPSPRPSRLLRFSLLRSPRPPFVPPVLPNLAFPKPSSPNANTVPLPFLSFLSLPSTLFSSLQTLYHLPFFAFFHLFSRSLTLSPVNPLVLTFTQSYLTLVCFFPSFLLSL